MPRLAVILMLLLAACVSPAPAATAGGPTASAPITQHSSPTPSPTPEPTAEPTESPGPTLTPDPAVVDLEVTSCNGGVVLRWSPSRHPGFHHYRGLRSPERDIASQYPPIAPAVEWGDLYATDPFVTSGFDASIVPSSTTWHYRVIAYDAAGQVVSSSSVESGRLHDPYDLGALEATALEAGRTHLRWGAFDGQPDCFSSYRVLYGNAGAATTLLTTVSSRDRTELETAALHPGVTYTLRVQAVRTTTLGHFVVGETGVLTFSVPEP